MTDADIAARIREHVGQLNHFVHVARHVGLFVQFTAAEDAGRVVSDVCIMRPILPADAAARTSPEDTTPC